MRLTDFINFSKQVTAQVFCQRRMKHASIAITYSGMEQNRMTLCVCVCVWAPVCVHVCFDCFTLFIIG